MWGPNLVRMWLSKKNKREKDLSRSLSAIWGHSEKVAFCKPGRALSMETNHAGTWILNFKPLELWGKKQKFLLFKIPSLCYFITVTTYSADFPFKLFWAVYYLAQILSFTCRNWNIKTLTYNYFFKKWTQKKL